MNSKPDPSECALEQEAVAGIGQNEWEDLERRLAAAGLLRLPGEDARVWRDAKWQEEPYGEKGRLPTDDDWKETRDIIRQLADCVTDTSG